MRRAVILFPSGLTLFNLFFGVFAIITASRGDFYKAGIYVLAGGICDALDGRVARATNAGSQFGEELDSLVDAISFGLAPAMIMYFAVLDRDGWQWVFVFAFAACAVMRLARFNIEQAGTAKTYFSGLPSPAAGCTLASYYWFSQSWLYNYGAVGNLPWQEMLRFLMAALAALMISPIPYPVFPRTGWRSKRALAGTLLLIGSATLLATKRLEYFFPLCLLYVAWGPLRWLLSGLFERRQPTIPYDLSEGEDEDDEIEDDEVAPGASQVHATRHGPREGRMTRADRVKKPADGEAPIDRPPQTEERPTRADRPARPDRADRPQRTEAERAARREKRETRDKRESSADRGPRTPRPADEALPTIGVGAISVGETAIDATSDEEVIGRISGDADAPAAAVGANGAPARKRKRRRRRGERKERGPGGATVAAAGDDVDGSDGGDAGSDDATHDGESASAYSAPPSAAPAESSASSLPPGPTHVPSSEPHE